MIPFYFIPIYWTDHIDLSSKHYQSQRAQRTEAYKGMWNTFKLTKPVPIQSPFEGFKISGLESYTLQLRRNVIQLSLQYRPDTDAQRLTVVAQLPSTTDMFQSPKAKRVWVVNNKPDPSWKTRYHGQAINTWNRWVPIELFVNRRKFHLTHEHRVNYSYPNNRTH